MTPFACALAGAVAARSRPAGAALDLSAGVSVEAVTKTISNLAMSIIGEDEAIGEQRAIKTNCKRLLIYAISVIFLR